MVDGPDLLPPRRGYASLTTSLLLFQVTATDSGVGPDELVDYLPALIRAGWFLAGFIVVVLLGWYVVAPAIIRVVHRRNRNNPTIREAIQRYVRLFVVVGAVVVGAAAAGFGGFLTSSAIVVAAATLAVGVAGQEVIGSIVSGLALVVDPEFNVGDYIEWADGEGTVRSITLRVTRVTTPNGELVTIPNTVLTGQAITRPFGRGRYRVVDHVGLAYEDDVDEAMAIVEEVMASLDVVLGEPSPDVFVDDLGADAVILRVHYWIEDPHRQAVFAARSAFAREVKARLEAAGITVSPPSKRDLRGRVAVEGER